MPIVAVPAEATIDGVTVPALRGECATAWYEEDGGDSLMPGPLLKAGWYGSAERVAALITFDLSFLPPGSTLSSARLRLLVISLRGDPESYGNLSAGLVVPDNDGNLEPALEWAYDNRNGIVSFPRGIQVDTWITADVTAGVLDRVVEHPKTDPGRLTFRVEFPAAAHGSEDDDYVVFGSTPLLALEFQLPDPITQRPVHRHLIRCIPVVASNAGAAGTRWVTELQLAGTGTFPSSVWLYFTPTESDGTSSFAVRRIDLATRNTVTYDDVLPDLFGLHDTKGWIEVFTTNPGLLITARVANVGGTGSYGQTVPMVDERRAATWHGRRFADTMTRHLGLGAVDAANRTNVGLVNLDGTASGVRLTARWNGGSAQGTVTVPAYGHIQINRLETVIPDVSGKESFFLEMGPTSGTSRRRIIGYLTRVDNTTGDAVFVPSE